MEGNHKDLVALLHPDTSIQYLLQKLGPLTLVHRAAVCECDGGLLIVIAPKVGDAVGTEVRAVEKGIQASLAQLSATKIFGAEQS